ERGALVGDEYGVATSRVADLDLARDRFAANGLGEELERVGRLASPLDDAVDAQFLPGIGLRDLPAARSADDDLEVRPKWAGFHPGEHLPGVVRVDRQPVRPENRRVDARREGHPQRVVS